MLIINKKLNYEIYRNPTWPPVKTKAFSALVFKTEPANQSVIFNYYELNK